MSNKNLKLITEENLLKSAKLFYDVFTSEPWNYNWMRIENINRYFSDLFITPNFQGFVYENNGEILGACMGIINDYFSTATYDIKEIFVASNMQHSGIGSRLLHEIEIVLQAQGVSAVTLFTRKQIPAYSFYVKNGYSVSEETAYFCKALSNYDRI